MLLSPDGRVQLNRTAATILGLCDGSRDREGVIAAVARRSHRRIKASDIGEFLDVALARGWIVTDREPS